MGERKGMPASVGSRSDGRLAELCASTADARRRLATVAPQVPGDLHARLAAIVAELTQAQVGPGDRDSLLGLLDEIGGLVGQLELEREAIRARILALDRHRQAQLSYAKVPHPQ